MVSEHVGVLEAHTWTVRHEVDPVGRIDVVEPDGAQLEVGRAVAVGHEVELLTTVLDGRLDAEAARDDAAWCTLRLTRIDEMDLVDDLGAEVDDHERLGARATESDPEALVVLLQDELVRAGGRTDAVTPHLVGPPCLVGDEVEERRVVVEPGAAVRRAVRDLLDRLAGGEIAHAETQHLTPVGVDADDREAMVTADREHTEREVRVALRLDVAVE